VCVMSLIVRLSLHFVVFGFFFKAVVVTSIKSLGHSPDSYMLLISCHQFEAISQNHKSKKFGSCIWVIITNILTN
jgi:hypothetical protein